MTTTTSTTASRSRASTIVWKLAMALTGLVFIAYLLAHMYGNLKVLAGQQAFDDYAHHLRVFGEPMLPENGMLWVARVVLLTSLVVHVVAAFKLWARASKARGQKYVVKKAVAATLSSRVMRWGGVALLLFIIFHLLHLTTHTINPGGDPASPYRRMVNGFAPENWWVTLIYLLALVALAMHVRHGVWSAAQTLGMTSTPKARANFNLAGYVLALLIAGGFAIVPLSVLFGIID